VGQFPTTSHIFTHQNTTEKESSMIELNRDVTQTSDDMVESRNFDALPAGWYTVQIDEVEMRETKSGPHAGFEYLSVRFSVVSGDCVSRKFWGRYYIDKRYDDPDKSWRQFDLMARSCKKSQVDDGDELLGEVLDVRVSIEQSTDPLYPDAKNKVEQYRSSGEGPMPPVAAAAANGGAAPWLKTA
jgi:hypothetical protein